MLQRVTNTYMEHCSKTHVTHLKNAPFNRLTLRPSDGSDFISWLVVQWHTVQCGKQLLPLPFPPFPFHHFQSYPYKSR